MCTSRRQSVTGVAKPQIKPGTGDRDVIQCFRVLSSIAKNTKIPWLGKQQEAFVDPDYPERHDMFAGSIDDQNLVEAQRLNETGIEHPCGAHSDKLNSPKPSMSMVVGLSTIVGNKRIAMNGYSRLSVDSFLKASGRIEPFVEHLLEMYSSVPYTQQVLSPHTIFDGKEVPGIPGYPVIESHCNMDPVSFHNQFLFHILVLAQRFRLTFPECIGLQTAYEIFPNTSYYFGVAACTLLRGPRRRLRTKFRGFSFGLAMVQLMSQFWEIARSLPSGRRPGRRFAVYNLPVLPEPEVWDKRCHHKMVTCLHVHALHSTIKSRKEKQKVYKSILLRLCGQAPKVGHLIMNHSMALMAQIGLLPAWIRDEAMIKEDSRYMTYFCGNYKVDKALLLLGCEKLISTVQAAFNSRFNRKFTIRQIENILCKVYRLDNSSDDGWFDLFFPLQNTFSFEGDKILIYSPDQPDAPQELSGFLINRWPYGDTVMGMEEMVRSMHLGAIMPTDKSSATFNVPHQLLFPTAQVPFDFVLNEVKRDNRTAQALSESVIAKLFI
jgi:hypothetical protein